MGSVTCAAATNGTFSPFRGVESQATARTTYRRLQAREMPVGQVSGVEVTNCLPHGGGTMHVCSPNPCCEHGFSVAVPPRVGVEKALPWVAI